MEWALPLVAVLAISSICVLGVLAVVGDLAKGIPFAHSRQAIPGLAPRGVYPDYTVL